MPVVFSIVHQSFQWHSAGGSWEPVPDFCAPVAEGEVEGVGGRSGRPPGGLQAHRVSNAAAVGLRLQSEVTAHLLHVLVQLLNGENF